MVEEQVLEDIIVPGYERVTKIENKRANLKAIIAIHNTQLGPALGGIRIYPYKNFDDALFDVLRLAKGMTYKAAIAELGLGGGKSVIIADPRDKNFDLLTAMGEAINSFNGKYISAEDVGCSAEDMAIMHQSTKYVVGLKHEKSSGNPSAFTARGVFRGIQSVLKTIYGSTSVEGKRIAIQGLGSVGERLADMLFWEGAHLIVTDIDRERVKRAILHYHAEAVDANDIYDVKCDIFSPCALGAILNDSTIPRLNCKAVAGCANNQLLDKKHGKDLLERDILYAPDYVINAGGLLNVSLEILEEGYSAKRSKHKVDAIFETLLDIFTISNKQNISSQEAADALAEHKIKNGIGKRTQPPYFHHSL